MGHAFETTDKFDPYQAVMGHLDRARSEVLVELKKYGWPKRHITHELWVLHQDIERACSSCHNLCVADEIMG